MLAELFALAMRSSSRRRVFPSGCMMVMAVAVIATASADSGDPAALEHTIARTGLGDVRGTVRSYGGLKVREFIGIRYAQPPTGSLRFSKPLPVQPWRPNAYDALSPGSWCTQAAAAPQGFIGSEDCLFLNVYAPLDDDRVSAAAVETEDGLQRPAKAAEPRAVMIFVHGGGFRFGSGSQYPGSGLAGVGDVVVVTFNYRLGAFGFLSTAGPDCLGNYGLWDQRAAVAWVRDNIAAFGGDPTRITIFGESAGAVSVSYQALSPLNDQTLFQRVIVESGSVHAPWAYQHAPLESAQGVAQKLACSVAPTASLVECLRSKSVADLMAHTGGLFWAPSVDGEFILDPPDVVSMKVLNNSSDAYLENFSKYDYLVGFNSQEGLLFVDLPISTPSINSISKSLTGNNVSNGLTEEAYTYAIKLIGQLHYDDESAVALFVDHVRLLYETLYRQRLASNPPDSKDLLWLYIEILGDFQMVAPTIHAVNLHATLNGTGKRYHYVYDARPSFGDEESVFYRGPGWLRTGADHMDELASVLGHPFLQGLMPYGNRYYNYTYTEDEKALSAAVIQYWTNYAKNGDPNVGVPLSDPWNAWSRYDLTEKNVLLIRINGSIMYRSDKSREDILWNHVIASSRSRRNSAGADGRGSAAGNHSATEQNEGSDLDLDEESIVRAIQAFFFVCVGYILRNRS